MCAAWADIVQHIAEPSRRPRRLELRRKQTGSNQRQRRDGRRRPDRATGARHRRGGHGQATPRRPRAWHPPPFGDCRRRRHARPPLAACDADPSPPPTLTPGAGARAGRRCQRRRGAGPALGGRTTGRWGSHPAVTDRAGGPRATGDAPRVSPRRADRSGSGGRVRQRRHGRRRGGALAVAQDKGIVEVGVGWGELEKMGGGGRAACAAPLLALCGVALPRGATQDAHSGGRGPLGAPAAFASG